MLASNQIEVIIHCLMKPRLAGRKLKKKSKEKDKLVETYATISNTINILKIMFASLLRRPNQSG
jgi:hypothetical protein